MPCNKLLLTGAFVTALSVIQPAVAQPDGSYQATCRRIHQRGPILYAFCLNRHGGWAETSLDLRSCQYEDIANRNGRLVCPGGRGLRSY
jgi:hypothetical protein